MIYRNTKTGAEIFSNSEMHAPGLVLVEGALKDASVEECHSKTPLTTKEPPLKKEAPDKKEQPKKKSSTKKKGTKK